MNPSAPVAGAGDLQLIAASMAAIGLSVWLVVRVSLHPFLSLICAAFVLGFLAGIPAHETAAAVQSGFADVLGGAGIVIALGLVLGAVLRVSGAAGALADASLRVVGTRYAPWGCLCAAMLIGLPLFFETGVVLLLPIVAAAAAKLPATGRGAAPALLVGQGIPWNQPAGYVQDLVAARNHHFRGRTVGDSLRIALSHLTPPAIFPLLKLCERS